MSKLPELVAVQERTKVSRENYNNNFSESVGQYILDRANSGETQVVLNKVPDAYQTLRGLKKESIDNTILDLDDKGFKIVPDGENWVISW